MSEQLTESIFDNLHDPFALPRKKMLPGWIKFFAWIFAIAGCIVPLELVIGFFNGTVALSLYGIATNQPFSVEGLVITALFLIKGIISYGMLREKDWAIKLAMADGIIGLAMCLFIIFTVGFITTNDALENPYIRFEIFFIIPYIYKMWKIKDEWEANAYGREQRISGS